MIVWITGIIGSGKSTLGAALAAHFSATQFVDGDFCLSLDRNISFDEKIEKINAHLLSLCRQYITDGQSLVIAYPCNKELHKKIKDISPEIKTVGIAPIDSSLTRSYSDKETARQKQMVSEGYTGEGFVDVYMSHPTEYLYDSLNHLLKELRN